MSLRTASACFSPFRRLFLASPMTNRTVKTISPAMDTAIPLHPRTRPGVSPACHRLERRNGAFSLGLPWRRPPQDGKSERTSTGGQPQRAVHRWGCRPETSLSGNARFIGAAKIRSLVGISGHAVVGGHVDVRGATRDRRRHQGDAVARPRAKEPSPVRTEFSLSGAYSCPGGEPSEGAMERARHRPLADTQRDADPVVGDAVVPEPLRFGPLGLGQFDSFDPAGRYPGSAQVRRDRLASDVEPLSELVGAVTGSVGLEKGADLRIRQLSRASPRSSSGSSCIRCLDRDSGPNCL